MKITLALYIVIPFGEGNGTPLQYSCLENPMDGGAWKAAVHGVAEGQTHSRAMPSFPSQLEGKIGLAWATSFNK